MNARINKSRFVLADFSAFAALAIWIFVPGPPAFAKPPAPQSSSSSDSVTFYQERKALLTEVSKSPCPSFPLNDARVTFTSLQFSGEVMTTNSFPHPTNRNGAFSIAFDDMKSVAPYGWTCGGGNFGGYDSVEIELKSRQPARHIYLLFGNRDAAYRFAANLNWLVVHGAEEQTKAAAAAVLFTKQAADWRAAHVKPAMPDEAHVHQVLAENAFKEKNFDKAIDEYEAALEIFPTWPDGQFNLAALAGETGDYEVAVHHMEAYLTLVPDSSDAQSARDQIIIWRDKLNSASAAMASAQPEPVKPAKAKR
ncbi:MAG: tetratricopeptide repeat protein [Candidatus Acidiferrales bacterium]